MTHEQAVTPEQAVPGGQTPAGRIPGAMVVGGRYRLLVRCGALAEHTFWQALDTHLNRHVALTFTRNPDSGAQRAAMVLAKLSSPGLARIFDVTVDERDLVVITEWVAGASLREVALSKPSALGSANALTALSDAAAAAHTSGAALGLSHPIQVRISNDGEAVLAYPSVSLGQKPADDVRGLGATLYALLTGRWPLPAQPGSPESGLPQAALEADGSAVSAREAPRSVGAAVDLALQGKVNAEQFRDLLDQALAADGEGDEAYPAPTEAQTASGLNLDLRVDKAASPAPARQAHGEKPSGLAASAASLRERLLGSEARSRKTLLIGGSLLAVVLLLLGYGAYQLVDSISGDSGNGRSILPGKVGSSANDAAAAPVEASDVKVVDFTGNSSSLDNPSGVKSAIDKNDGPSWQTDQYQQGPKIQVKRGVGLLVTLAKATKLQQVTVNSPSSGTEFEVYVAKSPNTKADEIKKLDDLVRVSSGKVASPTTTVTFNPSQPTSLVLVWLTSLAPDGGQYRSKINELSFAGSPA